MVFVGSLTGPSASGTLELPALGKDMGFGVTMWGSWGLAKMLVALYIFNPSTREAGTGRSLGISGQPDLYRTTRAPQ